MRKYAPLPAALFEENRRRFMQQMQPNSIAVFYSNDLMMRSGDTNFTFRQNADLFYLCGLDQEETILVLYPNCPKGKAFEAVVFTRQTNEYIQVWEGYKYTQEQVREISGVQTVYWTSAVDTVLNELILLADTIYLNTNENDRAHFPAAHCANTRRAAELRTQYPAHNVLRAQPIMKNLRMIKSQMEIDILQKACDITEQAFRAALQQTRPDQNECELEALIAYEFLRRGANGHAYNPIVASGANACILHYNDNCRPMRAGDLVLIDVGAEYANYAADLSRTFPINGRFTERQREVYDAVLRVKRFAENIMREGIHVDAYTQEVGLFMQSELIGLRLLDRHDVAKQNPAAPLYKKYFPHGTSHHLGLDVHDLAHRYTTMQAGMVFTCEPGIYIPAEGIGIRIEDDLVVQPNGEAPFNLMRNIPIEAEEIESLMQSALVG